MTKLTTSFSKAPPSRRSVWREAGYDDFADGSFGNGGQNLYVSRRGVLQRIFHFDVNRDGYVDLLFTNSQDMDERPPVEVCTGVYGQSTRLELPTQGAYGAALGDLTGDGYDDLVIANQHDGAHQDLPAYIYWGSPEGLTERYRLELPAPNCRGVAIGDFNGDGRPDLAFAANGRLRIFYQHNGTFRPQSYTDLDLEVTHLTAADIDGDGHADIYVRVHNQPPRVLWGGPDGISLDRHTLVGGDDLDDGGVSGTTPGRLLFVEGWSPAIVSLEGQRYLFRAEDRNGCLYPIHDQRRFGDPIPLDCPDAVAADTGDLDGDGHDELVVVASRNRQEPCLSWIYRQTPDGLVKQTSLETLSARDVTIADLDGDGRAEIAIAQGRTDILNTTESLIVRMNHQGELQPPLRMTTHDATAVLIGRTSAHAQPQVIWINHEGNRVRGDIPAYLYYGGPDGFSPDRRETFPGWSASDSLMVDFNDDGWADVLLCNSTENAPHLDPGAYVYWNSPSGFGDKIPTALPVMWGWGAVTGDFRHCGELDLIFGGSHNPHLTIIRGGPDGFDLDHPEYIHLDPGKKQPAPIRKDISDGWVVGKPREQVRWLLAADLNNNGWLDLVVSLIQANETLILWGGPDGFSLERSVALASGGTAMVTAADLTGNGYLDLVLGSYHATYKQNANDSYVTLYWGGPDGFSEQRRMQLPAHAGNTLAIADFNNNGILDLFVGNYRADQVRDLDSYIYWGQPGGGFSQYDRTRLFAHSPSGCIVADFNEDGWMDIALANHKEYGNHITNSQVWWNGPEGFNEKNVTLLPTIGPHGMIAVDPGNIADRGPEEHYTSNAHRLPANAKIDQIAWEVELGPKTWVRAQLRCAKNKEELDSTPWHGPEGEGSWYENGHHTPALPQPGTWVQYRLALGATNGGSSPRVTAVNVMYTLM
jgi:FG-GAP-like repeat